MLLKRLDDDPNFCHTTITYNAVIKALGSRRDYSEEALEFYQKMAL
jgi:pentatricopeptide repeat protein